MSEYPRIFRLRQTFPRPHLDNIGATVAEQLSRLALERVIQPGATIALTAGSRGVANIVTILRAAAEHLRHLGAEPFIVPAMGSHGGATAEGQRRVLATYGITESSCGCSIRSCMETVVVCTTSEGLPVHIDRLAHESDGILVIGRVKPHTRFVGPVESGLMKMMLIGLGKHAGALVYHQAIQDYSFGQILSHVAAEVLGRCKILGGLAVVENAYDETAMIEAVPPARFESREPELLETTRLWMPRLPFQKADIVLLDEIGKDISGSGLDTNIVGRKFLDHAARNDEVPKVRHLAILGLTAATEGNATGIGLAEFCRSRVIREMNVHVTRTNCLTGSHPTAAMLPLDFETDQQLLDVMLAMIGMAQPANARIMWAQNTLHLAEIECSEAFWAEACQRSDLAILAEPRKLPFGPDGNLPAMASLA